MKRIQESDDDVNKQIITRAFLDNGVENMVQALASPDFLYAFRFHPWRLLRLMATHPAFREAVNATIKNDWPRLWYDFACYAFPDIPVQLSVYYSVHAKEEFKKLFYKTTVNYDYVMACLMSDGLFLGEKETLDESMSRKRYRQKTLDESFFSRDLIKACEADEVLAIKTAECFKMLYPCGIPPAAYCFASQVELHCLLAELLPLFEDNGKRRPVSFGYRAKWHEECSDFLRKILKRYSIFGEGWAPSRYIEFASSLVTLDDLKKFLEPGYTSTLVGTHEMGKIYTGVTLSLAELARLLTEFIDKNKIHSFNFGKHDQLIDIQDRIIKAALRYDRTGALKVEMFAPSWVALPLREGEKSVEQLREQDLLNGLSHNPLYRDVLMRSAEPRKTDGTVIQWDALIKAKIDVIKWENASYPPERQPIPEYADISSANFACAKCQGRNGLCVEAAAPFRIFCNEQCRSAIKY
jgi:hypothetical protein